MPFVATSLLAVALVVVLAQWGVSNKGNKDTDQAKAPEAAEGAMLENVRVLSSQGGELSWTLNTRAVHMLDNASVAALVGVKAYIVNQSLDISADKGLYDLNSAGLTLLGNVVTTSEGMSMKTERLVMKGSDKGATQVASEGKVNIVGKGFKVQAEDMKIIGDEVRLKDNVRAEIQRK